MLLVLISQAKLKTDATAISIFFIVQLKIDAIATLKFFDPWASIFLSYV